MIYLLFVHIHVLACMYVYYVFASTYRGVQWDTDLLELELELFVNCLM